MVDAEEERETDGEAHEGEEDPVLSHLSKVKNGSGVTDRENRTHPENQLHISAMPTVTQMVSEEAPGMVVVLVRKQNSHPVVALWVCTIVVPPDYAEVQGAGGSHNRDVGKKPTAVVFRERVNGFQEERMAGYGSHCVVRDTRWVRST